MLSQSALSKKDMDILMAVYDDEDHVQEIGHVIQHIRGYHHTPAGYVKIPLHIQRNILFLAARDDLEIVNAILGMQALEHLVPVKPRETTHKINYVSFELGTVTVVTHDHAQEATVDVEIYQRFFVPATIEVSLNNFRKNDKLKSFLHNNASRITIYEDYVDSEVLTEFAEFVENRIALLCCKEVDTTSLDLSLIASTCDVKEISVPKAFVKNTRESGRIEMHNHPLRLNGRYYSLEMPVIEIYLEKLGLDMKIVREEDEVFFYASETELFLKVTFNELDGRITLEKHALGC